MMTLVASQNLTLCIHMMSVISGRDMGCLGHQFLVTGNIVCPPLKINLWRQTL
jgi:hypothetical protein